MPANSSETPPRSAIDRGYDRVTISDATACHDPAIQRATLDEPVFA
ncbi:MULTISPECIES: hypothetical protein [Acidiphilium]|uniref:Uncharacterized protein n=1 Tax=Acidiphilium rubrum TaxID=526 RepID=A0A8G2FFY7_ACIRU|nr:MULTISPECIES: hypothetical protein [Acidiphilium]SIQ62035.1 hypothetical protein SAMN05421828_10718 [Acidiphilium rubrum]